MCLLFRINGSVCSPFLRFSRRLLLKVLKRVLLAMFRMPKTEENAANQDVFESNYSMLRNAYCVSDVLNLYLEQSGNAVVQNMFCSGWTHDHYVGKVFVFAPKTLSFPLRSKHLGQSMIPSLRSGVAFETSFKMYLINTMDRLK